MGQNYEMSETCRLCDENCISMHSVFERVPEGQQVLQLIKDCLRILIYRTDPLPKQICDSCYTNLLNFSSFKRVTHENLDRQKEKLRECNLENNISVQLYLNALEQNDSQGNDNPLFPNSHDNDSGYYKEDKDNNESEMCAQLQKAIKDSLRTSKIQENHLEQGKLSNGHMELQDEDSQTSSKLKEQNSESPYSLYQNAESQSDMELCDSDTEYLPKIIVTSISLKRRRVDEDEEERVVKKRRFVGPQSRVQQRKNRYLRSLYERKFGKKLVIRHNPLTLLRCALNTINKTNVPDYECKHFETVEINNITDEDLKDLNESRDFFLEDENICNHCDKVFFDSSALATHECNHMYVVLGEKVDNSKTWSDRGVESSLRNKWWTRIMKEKRLSHFGKFREKIVSNFDDSTGRVNVLNPDEVEFKEPEQLPNNALPFLAKDDGSFLKGEVVLIDTQATINGILLSDLPKDGRRTLYKSVTVNGVKRKFCPLCRYTFKDNWAIESHYFSTACHYTCRFCGVRFNKQRTEFDAHIKNHIMCGDTHTTNIFASRKFQTTPKIINASHVKDRPPPIPRQAAVPKIKPIKMKNLLEKQQTPSFHIKQEIEDDSYGDVMKSDGSQNQAYFCRKCYQVFHKLDEFNVHNINCNGTAYSNPNHTVLTPYQPHTIINSNNKYHSNRQEPEKFSPAGRPMRNCVKEIGTYADDMIQEDVDYTPFRKLNHGKSARGYECALCSSCFPTVHSRNSHMRIHKSAFHELSNRSITITKSQKSHIAKKMADMMERHDTVSFNRYVNNIAIKQEPMEPIVEIHETGSNNFPSSIGSVSITPIPNASQRASLDPNIMRLVQNNPNITIKSMGDPNYNNHNRSIPSPSNLDGDGKCYRCLSCSKPFANKSNLYFHKKNQCSGSKYPCPFCKKRFGTEAAYSSHIFYNHPE